MKIIELRDEDRKAFSLCLEDWTKEAPEGAPRRARWVERFLPRGLRARLALDDDGAVATMTQHLPIEQSWVDGEGLRFMPWCSRYGCLSRRWKTGPGSWPVGREACSTGEEVTSRQKARVRSPQGRSPHQCPFGKRA